MPGIHDTYLKNCNKISDINEHLPTLYKYAKECQHITECGVRTCMSSYAFAEGLRGRPLTKLIQYDIQYDSAMGVFLDKCKNESIDVNQYIESNITCNREKTDLLFIDTWHVYAQLKREFEYWHSYVNKYIILHDTTIDEWFGESLRAQDNIQEQSRQSGFPINEICCGLWPAVKEFLVAHPEWVLHERFTNNNGLTILRNVKYQS